ncbi:hypothetical protein NN561_014767 [Cricetulus griseus]
MRNGPGRGRRAVGPEPLRSGAARRAARDARIPAEGTPGPHSLPPPPPMPSPGLTRARAAGPPPGRKEDRAARSHTGRDGDEPRLTSACRVGILPK